jgi:hypothetical protein
MILGRRREQGRLGTSRAHHADIVTTPGEIKIGHTAIHVARAGLVAGLP